MFKKILTIIVSIVLIGVVLIPITNAYDNSDKLQVLVISGQSNSAYRNVDVSLINEEVSLPSTNVYYYGTETEPIYYGWVHDVRYDPTFESYNIYSMVENNQWKIGGYEPVLAKYISDKTKCDVLIINAGVSSASIEYMQPETGLGGIYANEVINRAIAGIEDRYSIEKIGYVWIQGESNANTPISTYIEDFEKINSWYHDNGFDTCYMVQTRPYNSGLAAQAQLKICDIDPTVVLASTAPSTFTVQNGLMNPADNLHYTQAGRIIIANDICEVMNLPHYITDDTIKTLMGILPIIFLVSVITSIGYALYLKKETY